jgi:hypothetical protein
VRLGGEVDDGVAACHRLPHRRRVADVALLEAVAGMAGMLGDVGRAGGVGEQVEIHDLDAPALAQQVAQEVAADEAAAARDEDAPSAHGTRTTEKSPSVSV